MMWVLWIIGSTHYIPIKTSMPACKLWWKLLEHMPEIDSNTSLAQFDRSGKSVDQVELVAFCDSPYKFGRFEKHTFPNEPKGTTLIMGWYAETEEELGKWPGKISMELAVRRTSRPLVICG